MPLAEAVAIAVAVAVAVAAIVAGIAAVAFAEGTFASARTSTGIGPVLSRAALVVRRVVLVVRAVLVALALLLRLLVAHLRVGLIVFVVKEDEV